MKIVNIIGGLGNQMFQYAFAMALKERFPDEEVKIDISHFRGYELHNGFELERIFGKLELPYATPAEISKVSYYIPSYKLSRIARRILPKRKTEYIEAQDSVFHQDTLGIIGCCYYEGYWQSASYFSSMRERIIKSFQLGVSDVANTTIADDMRQTNSVAVHIRRGDYLKLPKYQNICNLDYYEEAISRISSMVKNPKYFIFSNDMEWCKENIAGLVGANEICYIDINNGRDSYKDIWLMSQCKNMIIANSSFSWWGAYLNLNGGMIISPSKWENNSQDTNGQICPDWIKI